MGRTSAAERGRAAVAALAGAWSAAAALARRPDLYFSLGRCSPQLKHGLQLMRGLGDKKRGDEARVSPSVWFGAYQRALAEDASDLGHGDQCYCVGGHVT